MGIHWFLVQFPFFWFHIYRFHSVIYEIWFVFVFVFFSGSIQLSFCTISYIAIYTKKRFNFKDKTALSKRGSKYSGLLNREDEKARGAHNSALITMLQLSKMFFKSYIWDIIIFIKLTIKLIIYVQKIWFLSLNKSYKIT